MYSGLVSGPRYICCIYLFIYLFRYNGNDAASNMAVVAVNMVSGWLPDKDSIHSVRLCLFPQSPEDQDLFFQTLLYTNCSACTQCLQTDPVVVPFEVDQQLEKWQIPRF